MAACGEKPVSVDSGTGPPSPVTWDESTEIEPTPRLPTAIGCSLLAAYGDFPMSAVSHGR